MAYAYNLTSLLFYINRALNLCRIFTELGESYLHVIVNSPGKVSKIVFFFPNNCIYSERNVYMKCGLYMKGTSECVPHT